MKTEFEATFEIASKTEIRKKLVKAGAKLKEDEFLQKRFVFKLPKGHEIDGGWLRVRQEHSKNTLSLKIVHNNSTIEDQKELEIIIDDIDSASELLSAIGCEKKAYQENLREKWILDNVEITIDEWPYLEPFVEIEGNSEEEVKNIAVKLGFNYSKAYFGSVDGMYSHKYNIPQDRINNKTPEIVFDKRNPFIM